jgi:hypothetical protein
MNTPLLKPVTRHLTPDTFSQGRHTPVSQYDIDLKPDKNINKDVVSFLVIKQDF